jgi:outer membrane protein TolC
MSQCRFHKKSKWTLLFFISLSCLLMSGALSAAEIRAGMDGEPQEMKLTLRDALILAMENNLEIKVSFVEQERAYANVDLSKGEFDPVLGVSVPLNKYTQPTVSFLEAQGAESVTTDQFFFGTNFSKRFSTGSTFDVNFNTTRIDTSNPFNLVNPSFFSTTSFTFRQSLLKNFGRDVNRSNIVIAENNTEFSQYEFEDRVVDILNLVQQQYWDLVYAKEDLKAKEDALELAKEQLRRNQIQVEVGTLAPIEISQAEYAVAQREQDIILANVALENAGDRLKVALNMTENLHVWNIHIEPTTAPEVPAVLNVDLENSIQMALENRPDYKQQQIDIINRTVLKKYADNQTLPDLEFRASWGVTGVGGDVYEADPEGGDPILISEGGFGDSIDQMVSGDFDNWALGLTLTYTLFNQTAEANKVKAELDLKQSSLQLQRLKQLIMLEVREAVRLLVATKDAYDKAKQARELAEIQLDAEQKKFDVGTSTNFQVLQYQKDLTDSITNEVMAKIEYNKSKYALEKVIGTFLDSWDIRIGE